MIYLNPNLRASYRDGYVIATFICDTAAELPAQNYIADYILEMGSTAHVIENATDYEMQSDGTWCVARTSDLQALVTSISNLESEMTGVHSDIDILTNQVGELHAAAVRLVDSGAKNLLKMTHASGSVTRYGVTCTWDTDAGTMTLNGSHVSTDSTAIFEFYSGSASDQRQVPAGDYVLTGCPSGGSTSTYRAALTGITGGIDTGDGAEFTLVAQTYLAYRILVSGNVSFSDMVFKPMVTYQDYYKISPVFVPYAPTNAELYALIRSYHP